MSALTPIQIKVSLKGRSLGDYTLDQDQIIIGRDVSAQICLENIGVSRNHARIERTGDGFFIEDTGSANGTFLNNMPVKRALLSHEDVVTIGKFTLAITLHATGYGPAVDPLAESNAEVIDGTTVLSTEQMARVIAAQPQPQIRISQPGEQASMEPDRLALVPWIIAVAGAFLAGIVVGVLI
jgi:pSer/pThr/pTyr-binding forkhead associated (FHA) protein